MVKKIVTTFFLLSGLILFGLSTKSQTKKTWTAPVEVTEMNGGKIYVSFCNNSTDSIRYRIKSECKGLKNIYTCFAFKYMDRNQVERTQMVRDIPLAEDFQKEYSIPAENGISRVSVPFLPETVVAYVTDRSDQTDIREN
ncbi:hypothetical protein SAMN06265348_11221 [Pedobacter westerhofensis]|uniref:Uncharacterized protein n=1 Tax=Pedobacter westerhofensis TaxID=425512 RepID=A0A521FG69_9SPHI|nr:hypothetical protein [Pedobacter westerhofensis]SMO95187.1 hypothetical protein SAMN06265348_11221 [Pedobacter westerhofensis]